VRNGVFRVEDIFPYADCYINDMPLWRVRPKEKAPPGGEFVTVRLRVQMGEEVHIDDYWVLDIDRDRILELANARDALHSS